MLLGEFLNFFITGMPGIGKTTLIKRIMVLLQPTGLRAGGILCPEIREGGRRLGFEIVDVLTGDTGVLSHVHQPYGPRIGKYRVNLADIARIAVPAIDHGIDRADYIVIDEIGPMELQGKDFQSIILKALNSSTPVLGIIHWRMQHPLINLIKNRPDTTLLTISQENRDSLPYSLVNQIRNSIAKPNKHVS